MESYADRRGGRSRCATRRRARRSDGYKAMCQCELVPLFDMTQPALAKHLKVLLSVGVIGTECRGLWA
jgi:hypothetical protein